MMDPARARAEARVLAQGWLSRQPERFRREVLARCLLQRFAPGEPIYRLGDRSGGLYGLVEGTLAISLAPAHAAPRFVQFGIVGAWAGEGPFLTGEPRRAELRAVTECQLLHLPLEAMHQLAARDPEAIRYVARITIGHFDVLARVIDDLLIPRADRRIAAVLQRASWLQTPSVPISQAELGAMANASRKQVNAALGRFAARGWVARSYRSVEILDGAALLRFASEDGVER